MRHVGNQGIGLAVFGAGFGVSGIRACLEG